MADSHVIKLSVRSPLLHLFKNLFTVPKSFLPIPLVRAQVFFFFSLRHEVLTVLPLTTYACWWNRCRLNTLLSRGDGHSSCPLVPMIACNDTLHTVPVHPIIFPSVLFLLVVIWRPREKDVHRAAGGDVGKVLRLLRRVLHESSRTSGSGATNDGSWWCKLVVGFYTHCHHVALHCHGYFIDKNVTFYDADKRINIDRFVLQMKH